MHSYHDLELFTNYLINERRAEADLERLRAEARRAQVGTRRGLTQALLARFLRVRIRPDQPPVLSFEKTGS